MPIKFAANTTLAVTRFAEVEGFTLIGEFVEVETGKGADALDRRPQLAAALAAGRARKCPVIVAKLDRLSRDVAFVSTRERKQPSGLPVLLCRSSMRFGLLASPICAALPKH